MFSIYQEPVYYQPSFDYDQLLCQRVRAAQAEAARVAEARAREQQKLQYLAYQQALRAELEAQARAEYEAHIQARAQLQAHADALLARREAQREVQREAQREYLAQLEAQVDARKAAAVQREQRAIEEHAARIHKAREHARLVAQAQLEAQARAKAEARAKLEKEAAQELAKAKAEARAKLEKEAAQELAKAQAEAKARAEVEQAKAQQAQIEARSCSRSRSGSPSSPLRLPQQLRFSSVEDLLQFVAKQNQRLDEEPTVEEPATPELQPAVLYQAAAQPSRPQTQSQEAQSPAQPPAQPQSSEISQPATPSAQSEAASPSISTKLEQLGHELSEQTSLVQASDRKLQDLRVAHSRTEAIYSALDALQVPKALRQQKHQLTRDAVALADSIDSLILQSSPRHHVTLEEVDEIDN